ncbi:MAG: hypothetical protein OEZ35_02220 [Candidatus Bathyarchaeota archaeon]|nr:hypothetical protein [Candidatus Bathyarchaeota archaeon]
MSTVLTLILTDMLILSFSGQNVGANDSWIWVRNTVTGYWGQAVVGTGNAIYVARRNSFYRYDPSDNSWTALAAPPNPDSGDAFKTGTALAWDFSDYIYALYGAASVDSRRWFYRYSISSNSWEALANTPADQGEGDAIAWVSTDNCIYATIGGEEERPTYFMCYDPSTNSWSNEPTDPSASMGDGASLVWTGGDYLYALRGEFHEGSPLYDFWRYSLTADAWVAMMDIPADPHDGGLGGVGDGGSLLYVGFWLSDYTDYIYALSGNQVNEVPDNRTYRYTISMNSWEPSANLPFEVGYYVGCRLGYADGYIYAWQGAPGTWIGGGDDLAEYELTRISVGIHDLRTILLDVPVNTVHFLYADPAYMARPEAAYDVTSGGIMYGLCTNPQRQGFNTTKHWLLSTGAINATTISNATIAMFGGPYPHVAVRYYEDSHVGSQDGDWLAPVRFSENASHYWFENQTYAVVGMLPISAVGNGHEDMFVIEVFSDGDNTVLIIYGFDWKGTWAGGICFKEVMLENLSDYEKQYYIFHWVDDSDQDSIPQSSEIVMTSSG